MQKAFVLAHQIWPRSEGLSMNLGLKSGKRADARGPGSLPQAGNLEGNKVFSPSSFSSFWVPHGGLPTPLCFPAWEGGRRGFKNEREPNSAQKPQAFFFPSPPLWGEDAAPSEGDGAKRLAFVLARQPFGSLPREGRRHPHRLCQLPQDNRSLECRAGWGAAGSGRM